MKNEQLTKTGLMDLRYYTVLAFLLMATFVTSCSKDNDPGQEEEEIPEDTTPADESLFNKLIRIENIPATQENDFTNDAAPVYFSLENKTKVDPKYKQTNRWDLAFTGLFNSFLSGNNGTNSNNMGYGNTAKGGITIVEKSFEDVVDIPADSQFKTAAGAIGTDDYGDYGEGIGWYLYDFYGTLVRNGAAQDAHICYPLHSGLTLKNGTVVPPRTVILRTAKGDYAKIKMISVYKDVFEAKDMYKDAPHVFFTFEYVLAKAGSTKFEIK